MRFTMLLLGAAAAVATSANATDWSGFSGTVTGGYNYSDVRGVANNAFDFGGAANYAIPDTHLNVQGFADYSETKSQTVPVDTWSSGGAVSWRDHDYAVGFNGDYNSSRLLGQSASYGNYGLFGEWYATNEFTVRLRGGGISGDFAKLHGDGGYFGGGASLYVLPQLALTADASYNTVSNLHWSTFEIGPEYMPLPDVPLSISAAYTHDQIGYAQQSLHSDGIMVRLAFHLGQGNSLAEFDRNGPLSVSGARLPMDGLTYIANTTTQAK